MSQAENAKQKLWRKIYSRLLPRFQKVIKTLDELIENRQLSAELLIDFFIFSIEDHKYWEQRGISLNSTFEVNEVRSKIAWLLDEGRFKDVDWNRCLPEMISIVEESEFGSLGIFTKDQQSANKQKPPRPEPALTVKDTANKSLPESATGKTDGLTVNQKKFLEFARRRDLIEARERFKNIGIRPGINFILKMLEALDTLERSGLRDRQVNWLANLFEQWSDDFLIGDPSGVMYDGRELTIREKDFHEWLINSDLENDRSVLKKMKVDLEDPKDPKYAERLVESLKRLEWVYKNTQEKKSDKKP